MFNCYKCGQPSPKLIGADNSGVLLGTCCGTVRSSGFNYQLNQTLISDGKTRVTKGKAWEIDNRRISRDDKKTVINQVTGKPAQF